MATGPLKNLKTVKNTMRIRKTRQKYKNLFPEKTSPVPLSNPVKKKVTKITVILRSQAGSPGMMSLLAKFLNHQVKTTLIKVYVYDINP